MIEESNADRCPDVVVVGAGVIGLAIAWRAAVRGLRATVVDPAPASGASAVAAGMLAPVTEAGYNEDALLRLNLDSAARYPGFVAELCERTGLDPAYRTIGTLLVAADGGDLAAAAELLAFQRKLGLEVTELTGREARRLEPLLAPGVRGGLLVAGDHQVDPRRLTAALLAGCRHAGVRLVRSAVRGVGRRGDRAVGVLLADGTRLSTGRVVLAAGVHCGQLDGLPAHAFDCLRPVKGQLLRLRVPPRMRPLLHRNLRGLVRGNSIYLVPRADGELVIGATVEEQGFDTTVTAGAVHDLLRDATELLPAIGEAALVETAAGLRPGTTDNGPLLGAAHLENLIVATGHYRNGVLLAPTTADAIVTVLQGGDLPALARPFAADRFGRAVDGAA
jgi:glycine oxidase